MSESIFDRLQKKLEVEKREEGISAIEIAELPPNLRKIMRMMLREVEMTYTALCQAIDSMPKEDRLNRDDLDHALETLSQQGWLIRRGEGEGINYAVNLRRKTGSSLKSSIWGNLDSKLSQDKDNK